MQLGPFHDLIPKNHPTHHASEIPGLLFARKNAVEEFERAFAASMGAPYGISFSHCRVAIKTALETLAPPGKAIVMTGYTCVVVAHSVVLAGMVPRFVDISLSDYNTPAEDLLREVDESVGAVLVTEMFGNHVDMKVFEERVSRPLCVIQDAALSLQPAFRPKNPNLTSVTCYSFGYNKVLSAFSGGILVTHDKKIADRLREARDRTHRPATLKDRILFFGKFLAISTLFHPLPYSFFALLRRLPFVFSVVDQRTSMDEPAFPRDSNVPFNAGQAMLGLSQLAHKELFLERRRYWAQRYREALNGVNDLILMELPPGSHFGYYPARVPDRDGRHLREKVMARGVELGRAIDYALPEVPYYKQFVRRGYPNSSRAAQEVIDLPNYPAMTEAYFQRVVDAVRGALKKG